MYQMSDEIDLLPEISYEQLKKTLQSAKNNKQLQDLIVNAPFDFKVACAMLFLGIIVLLEVDEAGLNINRIALSSTELAQNTTEVSYVPFNKIQIPLLHSENIIATAMRTGQPQDTTDWKFLFEPALTPEQARLNQASGGIAYSAVYPIKNGKRASALIFSYFQYEQNIGSLQQQFMSRYSELVTNVVGTPTS